MLRASRKLPPLILTNLMKQVLYQPLSQMRKSRSHLSSMPLPQESLSYLHPISLQTRSSSSGIASPSPQDFGKLASGKIARFAITYVYGQLNNVYLSHLMNVDEWLSNFSVPQNQLDCFSESGHWVSPPAHVAH